MSKSRAPAVRDNIRVVNPDGDEGGDPIVVDEDGDECVVVTRGGRARAWHPPDIGAAREGRALPSSRQCDHGLTNGWRFGKRDIEAGRYDRCKRCEEGVTHGEPACGGFDATEPGYGGLDINFPRISPGEPLTKSSAQQERLDELVRDLFDAGLNDLMEGGVHPIDIAAETYWGKKSIRSYFREAPHYKRVLGKSHAGNIRESYVIEGADPTNSGLVGGESDGE